MDEHKPWKKRQRFKVVMSDLFWDGGQMYTDVGCLYDIDWTLETPIDVLEHVMCCQDADDIIQRMIDNAS